MLGGFRLSIVRFVVDSQILKVFLNGRNITQIEKTRTSNGEG